MGRTRRGKWDSRVKNGRTKSECGRWDTMERECMVVLVVGGELLLGIEPWRGISAGKVRTM